MISFLEFIVEDAEIKLIGKPDEKNHIYAHRSWVGPHAVDVMFPHEGDGRYQVMARVNHSMDREKAGVTDPSHARRIAMTVRGAVDSFVRNHSPREISFSASSGLSRNRDELDWKGKHYGEMARRIAAKHGGVHTDDDGEHVVRFG